MFVGFHIPFVKVSLFLSGLQITPIGFGFLCRDSIFSWLDSGFPHQDSIPWLVSVFLCQGSISPWLVSIFLWRDSIFPWLVFVFLCWDSIFPWLVFVFLCRYSILPWLVFVFLCRNSIFPWLVSLFFYRDSVSLWMFYEVSCSNSIFLWLDSWFWLNFGFPGLDFQDFLYGITDSLYSFLILWWILGYIHCWT